MPFQSFGSVVGQAIAGAVAGQTSVDAALEAGNAAVDCAVQQAGYQKQGPVIAFRGKRTVPLRLNGASQRIERLRIRHNSTSWVTPSAMSGISPNGRNSSENGRGWRARLNGADGSVWCVRRRGFRSESPEESDCVSSMHRSCCLCRTRTLTLRPSCRSSAQVSCARATSDASTTSAVRCHYPLTAGSSVQAAEERSGYQKALRVGEPPLQTSLMVIPPIMNRHLCPSIDWLTV
jgi:hypothetical protein